MPVAVLINDVAEAPALMHWAAVMARADDAQVLVLWPQHGAPQAQDVDLRGTSHDEPLVAAAAAAAQSMADVTCRFRRLHAANPAEAVLKDLAEHSARLLIVPRHESPRGHEDDESFERWLFHNAPCDALWLRPGHDAPGRCDRILVPTSGGPNAGAALRLAAGLITEDGRIDALFVEPPIGRDAESLGRRMAGRAVEKALEGRDDRVRPIVTLARSIYAGIGSAAQAEDYDLLLIGASQHGAVRRFLFGTIPEKVMSEPGGPTLGVVRAALPLTTRVQRRVDRLLNSVVPQMDRDDRLTLVQKIQISSRWEFDFVALICLSTLIAGLGLIRNAASVVIGAMLVAPLMTPLVGSGLALVQGNLVLVRQAARSVFFGFCLAFAIGLGLGTFVPGLVVTPEMLSRGSPNVLDLAVAFASGMAAAYATARPNLSAVLPGVAIAAALIPPIATSGICLAVGRPIVAAGSALLFITNIVAIVIGAAISLYAVGIRRSPGDGGGSKRWARRTVLTLLVIANLLAIPLGYLLYARLPIEAVPPDVVRRMDERIARESGAQRVRVEHLPDRDGMVEIEVSVRAVRSASATLASDLAAIARGHYRRPVHVRILTQLVTDGTALNPSGAAIRPRAP